MKLIIDIPDETYNYLKETWGVNDFDSVCTKVYNGIVNGIPLPKGHGRLIDADALKKDDEVTEWCSRNAIRTGKMLKSFSELFIKKIDAAPTIIEADIPTMYYPQVEGITPTIIEADKERSNKE